MCHECVTNYAPLVAGLYGSGLGFLGVRGFLVALGLSGGSGLWAGAGDEHRCLPDGLAGVHLPLASRYSQPVPPALPLCSPRLSINTVYLLVLRTGLVYGRWHNPLATHGFQLAIKQPTHRWPCFGRLGAQPSTTRWSAQEPQLSNATSSKPAWQFWRLETNWWSRSLIGSAEHRWR